MRMLGMIESAEQAMGIQFMFVELPRIPAPFGFAERWEVFQSTPLMKPVFFMESHFRLSISTASCNLSNISFMVTHSMAVGAE